MPSYAPSTTRIAATAEQLARFRQNLPELRIQTAHYLPPRFSDSTNDLWILQPANQPACLLRIRRPQAEQVSPFWPGLKHLFGIDLQEQMPRIARLHHSIATRSPLVIPEVLASHGPTHRTALGGPWVLTTLLKGASIASASAFDIRRLAEHLAAMHYPHATHWGAPLAQRRYRSAQWPQRVANTIEFLAKTHWAEHSSVQAYLPSVLAKINTLSPQQLGWVLPDLRWDQFQGDEKGLYALVDVEAFVLGPIALDFIALEYQLDYHQARIFKDTYIAQGRQLPALGSERAIYRFLYFLLGILGENDLDAWMQHHPLF